MLPPIIRQASAFVLAQTQPNYRRFLYHRIDFSEKLIGIRGARGSGKTTLVLQYASCASIPKEKILYVACDHPAMVDSDLYQLAQTFFQEGGKLLLVDEVHKVKNFGIALKAIRDTFGLRVVFSGSSALRMAHELADLSRRAVIHDLPVLSLREFIELETGRHFEASSLDRILNHHQAISAEVCGQIRPIEYFRKYLQYGAYPFFLQSKQSYVDKLLEVIKVTIDSDLCVLYNIEPAKIDKLKKVLYMLCATPPVDLNKSKLSAGIGASWPTLSKYLGRMEAGGLIHIVRGGVGMRALNKPDKLLLNNPNLFSALCASPNLGSIRESFFVSQLSNDYQVHYHDRGDFVVDDRFVFEVGGPGKATRQLRHQAESYVAADEIETGSGRHIPLWIFGMSY